MTQDDGIRTKKRTLFDPSCLTFFVVFISVLRWVSRDSITVTVPHLFFMMTDGSISKVKCLGFICLVFPRSEAYTLIIAPEAFRDTKTHSQPPNSCQIFIFLSRIEVISCGNVTIFGISPFFSFKGSSFFSSTEQNILIDSPSYVP